MHGVKMGVKSDTCDDAKSNLAMDWGGSKVDYTCYNPQRPILPDESKAPSLFCEDLQDYYPSMFTCLGYCRECKYAIFPFLFQSTFA